MGICLTLASCDKKDHSDEPGGSTSTENGYGEIKPTGLKIANLYRESYNGDGPKELKIPGFPPLYYRFVNGGYKLVSEGGGLKECGNVPSMESFSWKENKQYFYNYVRPYVPLGLIYRMKVSKADEYPERFAYARIRVIDFLHSSTSDQIGVVLEYDSPYTPLQ